jgi:hypothetical protein
VGAFYVTGGKRSGEIMFTVTSAGLIDSIVFRNSVSVRFDTVFSHIIKGMSGKWRAGQVNGASRIERITLWYSLGITKRKKFLLDQYVSMAEKSLQEKNYSRTIDYADAALEYDLLNFQAVALKSSALVGLNKSGEACTLLKGYEKYGSSKIGSAMSSNCKP